MDLTKYHTERLYSDIESKGFWEAVNSEDDIWCLCSITEEDEVLLFHDYPEFDGVEVYDEEDDKTYTIPKRAGSLIEGVRFWYMVGKKGGKLSVHNCMTYDKPIVEKIWPKCIIPVSSWEDTFVQSKVQWFDRPCPKGAKSSHGLKAYGIKFGNKKPDITDWTTMDAYKLHRVVEDCRIQKMTAFFLDREAEGLKSRYNIDFSKAIEIEKEYAMACDDQEKHGALVDQPHIHKCIEWLDEETHRLSKDIEPLLPKTLKKKTQLIGRKDLAMLLLGKDNIPDELTPDGEVIKRYYKPHVNFYNKDDVTEYSGFHLSHGDSPKFNKLAYFREWVKANHPDTIFKEWEYKKEIIQGRVLDNGACAHFEVENHQMDYISGPHTRFTLHDSTMTQHEIVKGYLIKQGITWADVWNFKKEEGSMVRAEYDMEVRYPVSASPANQMVFEVKKGEPIVTSPKFGDKEYEQLGDDAVVGQDIAKYNTYMHRRRFLSNVKDPENKGLLSYIREDGRIPCGLGNFMTSTGRSNQRVYVNVPSVKALYGEEMRRVLVAPEGKVFVGADQKSSQLSIAAFIANNEHYYKAVASGEQFVKNEEGENIYVGESAHCVNARNFGLVEDDQWRKAVSTQDQELIKHITMQRDKYAKGCAFAVIFGCAGKKLGRMLDISPEEGNIRKNKYLKEMGLDSVITYVKQCEKQFKYGGGFFIPVMDYWLWCRGSHVGVNYFAQGLEAIIQKLAVLDFNKRVDKSNWGDHTYAIFTAHDEVLIETLPEIADQVGESICDCYTQAGESMLEWYKNNLWAFPAGGIPKICVDFAGGYSIGATYYDVH